MARAGIDACGPRLASWLPGSEAEPPPSASAPAEEPSATPSVLTKLQKWVRCLREGRTWGGHRRALSAAVAAGSACSAAAGLQSCRHFVPAHCELHWTAARILAASDMAFRQQEQRC